MSLTIKLALRLILVAILALGIALCFVALETTRAIENDIASTQARVSYQLERMHRGGNGSPVDNLLLSGTIDIVLVMTPGTCVTFTRDDAAAGGKRYCAGWNSFGQISPDWFRRGIARVLGPFDAVEGDVPIFGAPSYRLRTFYDPVAAATRFWQQARIVAGLASGLAAAIALLSTMAVAHALRPVASIVAGLEALKDGALDTRLARSGTREFDQIARAADELAERLERSLDDRRALMKRLFAVEEEERRNLARDLHDEFGQCLTATGALAASITGQAAGALPEIVRDAETISRIQRRMMETLRNAFSRLRPPDLEEMGLKSSLAALVRDWNTTLSGRTRIRLEADDGLDEMPRDIAIAIYRIVQEGLTNVARHARASNVVVTVERAVEAKDAGIEVRIVDDGVGFAAGSRNASGEGSGLIGMRERVSALGGWLTLEGGGCGARVVAGIPDPAPLAGLSR
ncbi:histidine kinase [Fulvimarina sp. 2208YS6-2-32]|uniref:Histidine kinase n=1 Tax=Fulvimarina uroteuthidis TaxID=3098149 RepID=A0ABU5I4P9_9HYPH|nr:histidine kinase [Fulvimarina sp. 2208YS6-2-32]MDY8110067.1 histidine kinase [Fulvimarina sp. 2208YS6-2-32]